MAYIVGVDGKEYRVEIRQEGNGYIAILDDAQLTVDIRNTDANGFVAIIDNVPYTILFENNGELSVNGETYSTQVVDEEVQKLIKASPDTFAKKELTIKAPMPGLVIEVLVSPGGVVHKGQGLLIIEAMKMQNEMKASRDGTVKQVFVSKGQTVNSGDKLIIIE